MKIWSNFGVFKIPPLERSEGGDSPPPPLGSPATWHVWSWLISFAWVTQATGNANKARITKWKIFPTVGFEPPTFRLRSGCTNRCATRSDSNDQLNVEQIYLVLLIRTPRGRSRCTCISQTLWQAKVDKNGVFSNITNSFSNITNSFSNIIN